MLSVAESSRASAITPRRRYARIPEVLEIPNLIELQLSSFDWFVEKGAPGAVRRDQPDQGLHRQGDGAPLPGLRVRRAQVHRARVPDQGPHLQPAPVRERRAPHQGDRRDPAPARLHGRLPVHDGPGHVHHQRRRARRRQPARPLAGRVLQRHRGSDQRPDPLLGQGHPEPRRLARVRDEQQGPARRSRSTASARSPRRLSCAPSATRPTTRSARSSRPWTATPSTSTSPRRWTRT